MNWTLPCPTRRAGTPRQGGTVKLEAHMPGQVADGLRALGHRVEYLPTGHLDFGAEQVVLHAGDHPVTASDGRCDGYPLGC